jgi:hypothetical protein
MPSLKGLICFAVFPELKKTLLEFYPFLIHIDSVELSENSEGIPLIEVEKSFRGTTLEELYFYLKENHMRLPIRVYFLTHSQFIVFDLMILFALLDNTNDVCSITVWDFNFERP